MPPADHWPPATDAYAYARSVSHVRFGRHSSLPSTTLHQVW